MLPSSSRILAEAIYFDIFANISFLPIHLCTWQNQFFLYFWTLVSRRNGKKNKTLQIRIKIWEHYAMVLQSYKVVYYFD